MSTSASFIHEVDFDTSRTRVIGRMLEADYFYSVTFSPDEKKLYGIPSWASGRGANRSGLYEYDLVTNASKRIFDLPPGWYTGNGIRDRNMNLYFAQFYDEREGPSRLLIIELKEKKQ
jgi:hypothetical protein